MSRTAQNMFLCFCSRVSYGDICVFLKREKGAILTEPSRHKCLVLIPTVPDLAIRGAQAALSILSLSGEDLHS